MRSNREDSNRIYKLLVERGYKVGDVFKKEDEYFIFTGIIINFIDIPILKFAYCGRKKFEQEDYERVVKEGKLLLVLNITIDGIITEGYTKEGHIELRKEDIKENDYDTLLRQATLEHDIKVGSLIRTNDSSMYLVLDVKEDYGYAMVYDTYYTKDFEYVLSRLENTQGDNSIIQYYIDEFEYINGRIIGEVDETRVLRVANKLKLMGKW